MTLTPRLLLLGVLFMLAVPAAAQNEFKHQIGLNANFFVQQMISLGSSNSVTSPYVATYKFIPKKGGIRAGLGANGSTEGSSIGGFDFEASSLTINGRLGYERQSELTERWLMYYGLDAIIDHDIVNTQSSTSFETIRTKDETTLYGGGPVLGFQFKLNSRLSLQTESAFYYRFGEQRTEIINVNFPSQNNVNTDKQSSMGFTLPTTLYFVVHF